MDRTAIHLFTGARLVAALVLLRGLASFLHQALEPVHEVAIALEEAPPIRRRR